MATLRVVSPWKANSCVPENLLKSTNLPLSARARGNLRRGLLVAAVVKSCKYVPIKLPSHSIGRGVGGEGPSRPDHHRRHIHHREPRRQTTERDPGQSRLSVPLLALPDHPAN